MNVVIVLIIIFELGIKNWSGRTLKSCANCKVEFFLLLVIIAEDKRSVQSWSKLLFHVHCMYVKSAFVWTSTKKEWNAQNPLWSCMFRTSAPRNLIMYVLTIYRVKFMQSTALLPALLNLWLLLVSNKNPSLAVPTFSTPSPHILFFFLLGSVPGELIFSFCLVYKLYTC